MALNQRWVGPAGPQQVERVPLLHFPQGLQAQGLNPVMCSWTDTSKFSAVWAHRSESWDGCVGTAAGVLFDVGD